MDPVRSNPTAAPTAVAAPRAPIANPSQVPPQPARPAAARPAARPGAPAQAALKPAAFGLPCSKCRAYYPASLTACPICRSTERVSAKAPVAKASPAPKPAAAAGQNLDEERERFLREYKAKLYAAHAQINPTGQQRCERATDDDHAHDAATVCSTCVSRLQERADLVEAALHIDLREATQIIYEAVWADTSDSNKTYQNAALALLTELRKRAGVDYALGTLQALPH